LKSKHSHGARMEKKEHPWVTWEQAERIDREHKKLEKKKKKPRKERVRTVRFKSGEGEWISFKARG